MSIAHYHIQTTRSKFGKITNSMICSHAGSIKLGEIQMVQVAQEWSEGGYIVRAQDDGSIKVTSKRHPGVKQIIRLIEMCQCEKYDSCKNTVWGVRI